MDWDKAKQLLDQAQRVVVLTHVNPDGDAIGSLLGLGHVLQQMGKTVWHAVDEGLPHDFAFLPNSASIHANLDGAQADLVIVCDCSDERRIGDVGKAARTLGVPFINVDHHISNTMFADANLVNADTVSTTENLLDWFDQLKIEPNADSVQCLLCGLVTDTLCFRTSNVTATTLSKAQRLLAAGGNLAELVQRTVSRVPTSIIRLWGQVMPTVRMEDNVMWAKVSKAAIQASESPAGRDGSLPSLLLQADDAYITCVLTEEDRGIDISLRAKPGFVVSDVAVKLGGGGHKLAAGAQIKAPIDEVEARVIPLLKEAVRAGKLEYD